MNAHKAIYARLSAFAGLTALVGTRISSDITQSPAVWPSVAFSVINTSTATGSTTDPPLATALVQVDSLDKTRLGARAVAAQVALALDRWRQITIAGVVVDDCFFVRDIDMFDAGSKVCQVSADYRIHYRE